jgi:hypothetical protein
MGSLRGNLAPEPFRSYDSPIIVPLRYEEIWKDPFPEPAEAEVRFDLGGKQKIAFVPLFIVDEANQTVQAALLGERGDMILVSFPPTNFGQTRFLSDEDSLMRIARPLVESQG